MTEGLDVIERARFIERIRQLESRLQAAEEVCTLCNDGIDWGDLSMPPHLEEAIDRWWTAKTT